MSESRLENRTLPVALGAEKSILSSCLQDSETFLGKAVEFNLNEDYFYYPAHKTLWEILSDRYKLQSGTRKVSLDLVSITQVLEDKNKLDAIGGVAGLSEIYAYAANHAHFEYHLEILRNKYILRSVINSCTDYISQAFDQPEEVTQFLDQFEQDILKIRTSDEKKKEETISELLGKITTSLQELSLNGGKAGLSGLSSGYPDLDKLSGGLKAGDMFVIAARPSMGKTSLMMNIVEHIVVDLNEPCLVFSCEMPAIQLAERLLFSNAQISKNEVFGDKPTPEKLKKIIPSISKLKNAPLYIDDTPSISINEVRAKARRYKREKGLSAIAIDYLQLMRSHTKQAQNSREREIAEISAGLKAIAKELEVPVVVLAQLNRGPESRTGSSLGVPRMSDLRESGAIEQDADMIGLLYRPDYYKDGEERSTSVGEAVLSLAKNRNGATGEIKLLFHSSIMRFVSRTDFDPTN